MRAYVKRALGLLLFLSASFVAPTMADETVETFFGALVEDAVATPAPAGGTTILRFRIDNTSGGPLTLTGVHWTKAKSGSLVMKQPVLGPTDISSLSILENEVLDLRSSHIWAELRDLDQPLKEGDVIEFGAVFRSFTVLIPAHVHSSTD